MRDYAKPTRRTSPRPPRKRGRWWLLGACLIGALWLSHGAHRTVSRTDHLSAPETVPQAKVLFEFHTTGQESAS